MIFEQTPEQSEGESHVTSWVKPSKQKGQQLQRLQSERMLVVFEGQ